MIELGGGLSPSNCAYGFQSRNMIQLIKQIFASFCKVHIYAKPNTNRLNYTFF